MVEVVGRSDGANAVIKACRCATLPLTAQRLDLLQHHLGILPRLHTDQSNYHSNLMPFLLYYPRMIASVTSGDLHLHAEMSLLVAYFKAVFNTD